MLAEDGTGKASSFGDLIYFTDQPPSTDGFSAVPDTLDRKSVV